MSVKERDPLTGHLTTGHNWNGIIELNTRVPRAVWFFIIVTHVWALVVWILMPAWPLGTTYTKGILGLDDRSKVEAQVKLANLARADWAGQVDSLPAAQILADPVLLARVEQTAHALFGDNCAACHGSDAAGGPGFPSLVDGAWLWGGDPDTIMETLRVGINSAHPDTRYAQMPSFGKDGSLTRDEIGQVADYVLSLSGTAAPADSIEAGQQLFADNCASCHGEDARGSHDMGAPDLTDHFWIYGGDRATVIRTLWNGRQGVMPTWEARLTETERKMLTVYLLHLGAGAQP